LLRRFAVVERKVNEINARRFVRQFVRRFAVVPERVMFSTCGGTAVDAGSSPHTPTALRTLQDVRTRNGGNLRAAPVARRAPLNGSTKAHPVRGLAMSSRVAFSGANGNHALPMTGT
jgi:hypothetical protein